MSASSSHGANRPNFLNKVLSKTTLNDKPQPHPHKWPIIVHCHLRWDFVWQRPQQFLSRLSKNHRVLFVEGPFVDEGDFTPCFKLHDVPDYPNVTVLQSHFPSSRWHDGAWVDAERRRLLKEALAGPLQGQFAQPVQWFYDPMAVTSFSGYMNEIATVYDCMDQLSQFKFAPPELVSREKTLLLGADVVFAGGRKMWEDKRKTNSNSHFYGCGVDVGHFGKARKTTTEIPADLQELREKGPVLGFFGVVDERMDYELFAKLADSHSDWQIAIVGPFAKVNPDELPHRENLHYLGGRDYSQLPAYTKGFDVCLMPFARNAATEYINPTKALEYMATGKEIVSTDVPDVVSNFAEVVKIASTHEEFLALCEKALAEPDKEAIETGLRMAVGNTWDAIVAKLEVHIEKALLTKALAREASRRQNAPKVDSLRAAWASA